MWDTFIFVWVLTSYVMETTAVDIDKGVFGFDGQREFQVVRVSPDGFEVTIEYTDGGSQCSVRRNRFTNRNGELRL